MILCYWRKTLVTAGEDSDRVNKEQSGGIMLFDEQLFN